MTQDDVREENHQIRILVIIGAQPDVQGTMVTKAPLGAIEDANIKVAGFHQLHVVQNHFEFLRLIAAVLKQEHVIVFARHPWNLDTLGDGGGIRGRYERIQIHVGFTGLTQVNEAAEDVSRGIVGFAAHVAVNVVEVGAKAVAMRNPPDQVKA